MFFTLVATLALALSAIAVPVNSDGAQRFNYRVTNLHHGSAPHELIVFNPTITSPTAGEMWEMGKTYNAAWDTSNIPPEKKNATGLILLGYQGDGTSENLDIHHPLASDFPLAGGSVPITMPTGIQPRPDYFVVIFGDSGNTSPQFSIVPPTI